MILKINFALDFHGLLLGSLCAEETWDLKGKVGEGEETQECLLAFGNTLRQ